MTWLDNPDLVRLAILAVVCIGAAPFAGLLLFMTHQYVKGRVEKPKGKPREDGW